MSTGIGFYDSEFFVIKKDRELVSESLRRIIMTNSGERINSPYFGVDLRGYLFEPQDDESKKQILSSVKNQIEQVENRVIIAAMSLIDNAEENSITLELKFALKSDASKTVYPLSLTFQNTQ